MGPVRSSRPSSSTAPSGRRALRFRWGRHVMRVSLQWESVRRAPLRFQIMQHVTRRSLIAGGCASLAASGLAGCVSGHPSLQMQSGARRGPATSSFLDAVYGPVEDEPFPIDPVNLADVNPAFLRAEVDYAWRARAPVPSSSIPKRVTSMKFRREIVQPGMVSASGRGLRLVRDGNDQREARVAGLVPAQGDDPAAARTQAGGFAKLQGGLGMPGGPGNPLGARAMYLWQNNRDTLYRIHTEQRARDHRHERLFGVHPDDQSGRDRLVLPRADRNQGRGPSLTGGIASIATRPGRRPVWRRNTLWSARRRRLVPRTQNVRIGCTRLPGSSPLPAMALQVIGCGSKHVRHAWIKSRRPSPSKSTARR